MKPLEDWQADCWEAVQRFSRHARECNRCGLWGWDEDDFTQDDEVCDECTMGKNGENI